MCCINKSELPHTASGILQEEEEKNSYLVVDQA